MEEAIQTYTVEDFEIFIECTNQWLRADHWQKELFVKFYNLYIRNIGQGGSCFTNFITRHENTCYSIYNCHNTGHFFLLNNYSGKVRRIMYFENKIAKPYINIDIRINGLDNWIEKKKFVKLQ